MSSHEQSIVVDRPRGMVYDQWTRTESYPLFMDSVDSVTELSNGLTRWRVTIAGVSREYLARTVRQVPDELVRWVSVEGPRQAGEARFTAVDAASTRVSLLLDFDPAGMTETLGDAFGFVDASLESSLENFKHFMERRDRASGGRRGSIDEEARPSLVGIPEGTAGPAARSADRGAGATPTPG